MPLFHAMNYTCFTLAVLALCGITALGSQLNENTIINTTLNGNQRQLEISDCPTFLEAHFYIWNCYCFVIYYVWFRPLHLPLQCRLFVLTTSTSIWCLSSKLIPKGRKIMLKIFIPKTNLILHVKLQLFNDLIQEIEDSIMFTKILDNTVCCIE